MQKLTSYNQSAPEVSRFFYFTNLNLNKVGIKVSNYEIVVWDGDIKLPRGYPTPECIIYRQASSLHLADLEGVDVAVNRGIVWFIMYGDYMHTRRIDIETIDPIAGSLHEYPVRDYNFKPQVD